MNYDGDKMGRKLLSPSEKTKYNMVQLRDTTSIIYLSFTYIKTEIASALLFGIPLSNFTLFHK